MSIKIELIEALAVQLFLGTGPRIKKSPFEDFMALKPSQREGFLRSAQPLYVAFINQLKERNWTIMPKNPTVDMRSAPIREVPEASGFNIRLTGRIYSAMLEAGPRPFTVD